MNWFLNVTFETHGGGIFRPNPFTVVFLSENSDIWLLSWTKVFVPVTNKRLTLGLPWSMGNYFLCVWMKHHKYSYPLSNWMVLISETQEYTQNNPGFIFLSSNKRTGLLFILSALISGEFMIFQTVAPTPKIWAPTYFCLFSPESAWNWRNGPEVRIPSSHLYPPMIIDLQLI